MRTKQKSKVVGSPGWHIFFGLALGWAGIAGASEAWRNRLFVAGLIVVLLMGVAEVICLVRARSDNAEPGAPPNGGPATQPANSGVTEGPPSVS